MKEYNRFKTPTLETERLKLEPISTKFCSTKYVNWLNDPEIYQYLDNGGSYTYNLLFDYLTKYTEQPVFFWAIITKKENKHIGNIKIDPINKNNQTGEYGILIGDKKTWGQGYAKEASKSVIDYCFKILELRKITLGVIKDNIAAVKLYQNLGFETEGIYKMHGIYNGKFCDALRMARFNLEDPRVVNYFQK
jgi:ribosomal-protein-alanine N-acetyltransferase